MINRRSIEFTLLPDFRLSPPDRAGCVGQGNERVATPAERWETAKHLPGVIPQRVSALRLLDCLQQAPDLRKAALLSNEKPIVKLDPVTHARGNEPVGREKFEVCIAFHVLIQSQLENSCQCKIDMAAMQLESPDSGQTPASAIRPPRKRSSHGSGLASWVVLVSPYLLDA
jgi:hypothetical protein